MVDKIDLVVPYVDSSDPQWQNLFNEYNPIKEELEGVNAKNRFRGQGDFFRYWFRCVEQNLPWINKIHLIVQSDSQVPNWLDKTKVNIVHHEDFIPKEYLPTFNSTCIEIFIPFIPNLSEKFLYANDDFYAIRNLKEEWFFENNNVKNMTISHKVGDELYSKHCLNSYCLAWGIDISKFKNGDKVPALKHCIRPYLKSVMVDGFEKHKKELLNSISKFREEKNINMYFYDHYIIEEKRQEPKDLSVSIVAMNSNTSDKDKLEILNRGANLLAIQDTNTEDINIYDNYTLRLWFNKHYPIKSKYEV